MPPVHPAIVHFPIALGISSIAADSFARLTGAASLIPVAQWLIAAAAVGALIAIAAGYWDMKRDRLNETTHQLVHLHRNFGVAVESALVLLAVWRWSIDRPSILYLVAGWAAAALTVFQAWLGGELVYAHGAGVAPTGQGTANSIDAQGSSRSLYRMLTGKPLKSSTAQSRPHGERNPSNS